MNRWTRRGRAAAREDAGVIVLCQYFDDPGPVLPSTRPATCAGCGAAIRVSASSPRGRLVCFVCAPLHIDLQQPRPAQVAEIEAATGLTLDPDTIARGVREASAELARRLVELHRGAHGAPGGRS